MGDFLAGCFGHEAHFFVYLVYVEFHAQQHSPAMAAEDEEFE